jgi:hypothetical protein
MNWEMNGAVFINQKKRQVQGGKPSTDLVSGLSL